VTAESEAIGSVEALAAQGMRFARESADGLTLRTRLIAAGLFVAVIAFLAVAFWPGKPVHEDVAPRPQERHVDGSVTAAQAPDAHPPAPKMMLPTGAVRERAGRIIAHQAPAASSIEIDTEFVRIGNRREMHVTSPDGTIDAAVDVPIEPALIPPPPKPWAAGLGYTTKREVGVWLERRIGERGVLGVEVLKGAGAPRAEVRVGVSF
jgi:hypothetical protein